MKRKEHLKLEDRGALQAYLNEQLSIRYISDRPDKSPSTISREIKKHTIVKVPNSCNCTLSASCTLKHVCGSGDCKKKCKMCSKAKKYCTHYDSKQCETRLNSKHKLCNGCSKRRYCHLEKHFYDAKEAHRAYKENLNGARCGFDLTLEELNKINAIVSPAVKKGQSLYHIVKSNQNTLGVSESTLRRLIAANEMDVINLDLPETVSRKPRRNNKTSKLPPIRKEGRLYKDFLELIRKEDIPVTQMDCVEGIKEDNNTLLTLHLVKLHMQLVFNLEKHTSEYVLETFDTLERTLGKELFAACFPLILTDNGPEFSDIEGMERSIFGGKRTSIYFCDPNRSDEKGQCENNHKIIRNIIPKGTSIKKLTGADALLITNHINSYLRKSLFGKCPYDLAEYTLPAEFFNLLGLKKISANEVNLTPKLIIH